MYLSQDYSTRLRLPCQVPVLYGKIKYCMDTKNTPITQQPPKMVQALLKGFNTVANHAYLILFPFLLDVFIWLGPNLSTNKTLGMFMEFLKKSMTESLQQPAVVEQFKAIEPEITNFISSFDLFGFLNTQPIGVPSLIAFQNILQTPFGSVQKIITTSFLEEFVFFLLILLIGSVLGGIYFSEIGRFCSLNQDEQAFSINRLLMNVAWLVLINVSIWVLILLILFPSMTVIVLISMISGMIGSIANFLLLLLIFWMLIPLIFTPHGVIILHQDPFKAMLGSIRLIRYYLPGTGFFILFSLLIYQGFNQFLWLKPAINSYMLLGGIFGHAFICTGLLAASFMYYQDGLRWMNHNLKMIAKQPTTERPYQA